MKYRSFPNTDITASVLGMGCMRLPTLDGKVNRPEAIKMIRWAIDNGVTYVDTAYPYHGGESELVVGEALKDGYREKVTLATKLPMWKIEKYEDMEATLDEQLKKLQVDHVDFYLLHALDIGRYRKAREMGVHEFLDLMVKKGKIRYPAFSFHDDAKAFAEIATDYDWKLIQVQMNLLDEFNQATYAGIQEYCGKRGIGVVIMEPLRGGALAKTPPKEIQAIYDGAAEKRSAVEWALRWLYDKPEIVTILSGMSNMDQLNDNLRIFDSAEVSCLSEADKTMLTNVRLAYEKRVRVGCTGCEYCQPCPSGVKIPRIFQGIDNATMFGEASDFKPSYEKLRAENADASQCVKCGACEAQCPQHFPIRDLLEQINAEFSA